MAQFILISHFKSFVYRQLNQTDRKIIKQYFISFIDCKIPSKILRMRGHYKQFSETGRCSRVMLGNC